MGESDKQPDEDKCVELATAFMNTDTMLRLIQNLSSLPFEARKETAFVCIHSGVHWPKPHVSHACVFVCIDL